LLVITGAFALGGGIAAANRLGVHALVDAGYHIDLFALNEPVESSAYDPLANVRVYRFKNSKPRFTLAVWRALLAHHYTFVFCDHVNLASILWPLSKMSRTRYIVRLNGIEVFAPLPDAQGRLGLAAATRLTAISNYTRSRVQVRFPHLKITTCDLAIDPVASDLALVPPMAWSEPLTLEAVDGSTQRLGPHVLLHVGRMETGEQYKGQDAMIHALPLIRAQHPDVQLVLVGKGSDRARLLELAQAQPAEIRQAIFMPGYVTDEVLQQLYQHCYLFTMPSRGEGFGLVYLEAMRWAKPCLGSNQDAAQCIIRDRETGILVNNPTDAQEIAARITALLAEPERAVKMGEAGYALLCERFLYPSFKERFLDLVRT